MSPMNTVGSNVPWENIILMYCYNSYMSSNKENNHLTDRPMVLFHFSEWLLNFFSNKKEKEKGK